jgi:hypothetical protein
MRNPKYFALPFVILFSLPILPSSSSQAQIPTISTSGSVIYPPNQPPESYLMIRRQIYQSQLFSPETFASMSDLWIGHWDGLAEAQAIEAIRPDVLTFVYFNTRHVWREGSSEYNATRLQLFIDNDWILRDADGNYVTAYSGDAYIIDFGNPSYHTWLANWYKGYIDQYGLDGASLDNWSVSTLAFYGLSQTPINPRTGTTWTSQQVCDAYKALTIKIRDIIGSGKHVHVNGVYSGNHFYNVAPEYYIDGLLNGGFDALTCEAWVSSFVTSEWYSEDSWLLGINFAVWMEDNFLSRGNKIFMTISENAGVHYPVNQVVLPSGVTKEQYVTYCYASRLLAAKNNGNYVNFGLYMPEDYPQSLFRIELGNPLAAYYIVAGTHVYVRDFSKVKVLVNPTYDSYSVNLDGNYETLGGVKVTSPITVAPHVGIILRRL